MADTPHPHHKMPWRAGCSLCCREGCPVADTPYPHHKMPWRAGCRWSCREGCPGADTWHPHRVLCLLGVAFM